ncbi:hypothetical protein E2542_SST16982 [Spatholobus suberectus]|nr:hypothetical protein E2542_SST16982 [Spatholobus suberectus]
MMADRGTVSIGVCGGAYKGCEWWWCRFGIVIDNTTILSRRLAVVDASFSDDNTVVWIRTNAAMYMCVIEKRESGGMKKERQLLLSSSLGTRGSVCVCVAVTYRDSV